MPHRIATRSSDLALWQANHIADLLRAADADREIEIVHVSTIGDRDQSEPLHEMGGQGVFTREVQRAVLDGHADIAVHSLKDLPTQTADGLCLAAVPARAVVYDALVLPKDSTATELNDLPAEARIGTGSLRRQAQLLHARDDLRMAEIRGNVPTRLAKLDRGDYDALVLASAGLERLGLADRISQVLQPPLMFPAVGQGALGLECRDDDDETRTALAAISHHDVFAAVTAERALLSELQAGCHAPVGAVCTVEADTVSLTGVVLSRDGQVRLEATNRGEAASPDSVGRSVARDLTAQGAAEWI